MEHTQEPWKIEKSSDSRYHIIGGSGFNEMIAITTGPQALANAQAIVALPELLKGCKAAYEYLSIVYRHMTDWQRSEYDTLMPLLSTAMAKAKGK